MKKPIYKRWWFIVIMVILVLGIIGGLAGGNTEKKKEEPKKETIEQIVQNHFKDSKVKVEYDKDSNNLYLSVDTPDYQTASSAFNVEGGNLARCIKEVQKEYPNTNWQDVSISCKTFPCIINCIFNADVVKNYKDWDNFTQSDLKKLCDAYSDCQ